MRPLDPRVGRTPTPARGLNLADPLSRLLLSPLALLGMPRIASLRETPGRPAVRRESTDTYRGRTDLRENDCTDKRQMICTDTRLAPCTDSDS